MYKHFIPEEQHMLFKNLSNSFDSVYTFSTRQEIEVCDLLELTMIELAHI